MKIPLSISTTENCSYCLNCYNDQVVRKIEDGFSFYSCSNCGLKNSRRLVIDNKITWWIDTNGTYWHESIGVLIQNDLNQILCLNRCIYPFALALPAGHLDRNEEPLLGAQREVREETGIIDLELQLLKKFSMEGDSCARGCDDHQWSLFIGRVGENPTLEVCDEAKSLVWLSVPELLARNDVSYALSYILKHFYKESSGQFA